MGSGSGSVRYPERENGRHHRAGEQTEWIPVVGANLDKVPSHAKPMTSPTGTASEARDRIVDTGPPGLHTFNLGSVPASVTPPRTWRRAAWFAIFASAAALVGLLAAMSVIVGPVHLARIDALPSLPTAVPFPDSSDTGQGVPDAVRRTASTTHEQPSSDPSDPRNPAGLALNPPAQFTGSPGGGGTNQGGGTVSTLPGGTGPGGPGGPTTTGPGKGTPAPPPVVTVTTTGPPVVDPTTLNNKTQAFFSEVTSNVNAAAALTDDTLRDDVRAIIERRYGDISLIQVKSISLDPTNGVTISLLHVVNKNGTTSDETATLRFTLTSDPKITNPGG